MTKNNSKSNFGKYLRYNLSKRRAVIVIFAILNLVTTLLPAILYDIAFRRIAQEVLVGNEWLIYGTPDEFLMLILYAIPISLILTIVMTIKSFKIYFKRPDMDTLGSLPVSYKERFWGDFLGAVLQNFMSFVPMYLISLFVLADMKRLTDEILNSVYELDLTMYITMFSALWLMLLLVYLGVCAVTAFVCSCCGKKASAILYSIILMAMLPGIFGVYVNYIFSYVVGMDAYAELTRIISMLPPLGPVVAAVMESQADSYAPLSSKYYNLGENPFGLVIFLLITAAFIAGAYFIGKRRRAERVGESFAFKSVYHALTLSFMVLLIGASFVGYSNIMEDSGVQWVLLFTFIVYAALEVSENKSFKGFWKTAVRYAAVFGVCIGFFALVKSTNAFDMYKALPSAGSVKEIRLSGKYFYTPIHHGYNMNTEYSVSEKESVSEILNAHADYLEGGDCATGNEIKIVYALKDGREVTRMYTSKDAKTEAEIKSLCDNAKQLPDFDFGNLGIIDEPDLEKYTISYHRTGKPVGFILREKLPEFAELLREDIKYNYSNTGFYQETVGWISFMKNGEKLYHENDYYIYPTYDKTIEFLNDPGNFAADDTDSNISEISEGYMFRYNSSDLVIDVHISRVDTSPAAKELLSYIRPRREDDDIDINNGVRISGDSSYIVYTIDKANEQRVVELMLELFLEKYQ